jgi:multidrug efflux pump subunit AcrA (membrane-fusion protein)
MSKKMIVIALCITAFIVTAGCAKKKEVVKELPVPEVQLVQPKREQIQDMYQASGSMEAMQTVELASEISGKIRKLYADEGQRVSLGMLVVDIEDGVQKSQLAQAQANLMKAKAEWEKVKVGARPQELASSEQAVFEAKSNFELAQLDYQRVKNMFEKGVASRQELDSAENNLKIRKAALGRADESLSMTKEGARKEDRTSVEAAYNEMLAMVDYYKVQLSKTKLYSPTEGVITARYKQVGNMVTSGQITPIMKIEKINPIKAVLKIPQEDQFKVKTGQAVYLKMDDGSQYIGKVSMVSPAVDLQNRTVKIEALLPNDKGILKPGLFVEGKILLQTKPDVITVPSQAVIRKAAENTFHVFVMRDGIAKSVTVTPGIIQGAVTEILAGLTSEDQVITTGFEKFSDGDKVKPVAAK